MVKQLECVEQNSRKRRMDIWRDFEVCVEINLRGLAWVRLNICRFWKHNRDNIRESTVLGERVLSSQNGETSGVQLRP